MARSSWELKGQEPSEEEWMLLFYTLPEPSSTSTLHKGVLVSIKGSSVWVGILVLELRAVILARIKGEGFNQNPLLGVFLVSPWFR